MLNRFFGARTHTFLHILGLSGLAFGLPMNKVVMSVSMMFLVLNLLLEADFKTYWVNLKQNRFLHLILAFFLWHVVSLLWSEDLAYGTHDLRVKLPLLVIPVILAARPIRNSHNLFLVLSSFVASVAITSLINYLAYTGTIGSFIYDDIRGMSLFGSHVRYGLLVAMACGVLIWFIVKKKPFRLIWITLFVWLNFYTFYSQVLSGAISLGGVYFIAFIYWVWQKSKIIAISSSILFIGAITITAAWILKPITYNLEDYKSLPKRSAEGNLYYHLPTIVSPETKKPVDIFIVFSELEREWNKVSTIPFEGKDVKGQPIQRTLIRYMASKDLKKDAEGFKSLKPEDIHAIEQGNASQYHVGLMSRIYGLQYQLNNATDPNGHSFLQRLEYWKTGKQIAKNNWLIGTGNGDVQQAFNKQYEANGSLLIEEHRDRTHNMYLTILLSLGIPGLLLLLWSHISYFRTNFLSGQLVAIFFMTIILLSYLVEDTLETQTGVTFFALFYGLFFSLQNRNTSASSIR